MVTSREAGSWPGVFEISAQLESLMATCGRLTALVGAGFVAAAWEFDWVVHSEIGPSWPAYGWPTGASGRLNPGWLVPDASSSPCTGPKTKLTGLEGVWQYGDCAVGAQAQEDGYRSHFC